MKVKLIALIILSAFLIAPISSIAQTATSTPTQRNTLKETMSDLKNIRKDTVSQANEATKDKIQELKSKFKERLALIKDEQKRIVTERIDANIANLNKKHTDRFNQVLNNLQMLLDELEKEVKDAKTILLVKEAQEKIDVAKSSVDAQAEEIYTIEITTDLALRKNVGLTISEFRKDLVSVFKLVVDAKQAVLNLKGENVMMKKEATSSANL